MVLVVPSGLTERPKNLPFAILALTVAISVMELVRFVFLSRHEFSVGAKEFWFETFGYDPVKAVWWSAFTSLLVHADFLHAAVNLFGLWLFGWFVELGMGWKRFVFFAYIAHLTALKAQTEFWLWQSQNEPPILVGSSALVAFCSGAFCIRFREIGMKWRMFLGWRWQERKFAFPIWWLAAFWFAIQLAYLALNSAEKPALAHILSFALGASTALLLGWHWQGKSEGLRQEAKKAEGEKRWLKAAELWSQVAQLNPNEFSAKLAAARNFLVSGDLQTAEKFLRETVERFVWDEKTIQEASKLASMEEAKILPAELAFSLAEQLERHKRYSEAIGLFQIACEVPNFSKAPQALLKTAELFWKLGAEDRARQTLHLFWLRYGQTHWGHQASSLVAQFRQRGEQQ